MKISGTVRVTSRTLELLAHAAKEHRISVYRQASLALEVAARVFDDAGTTSLVPAKVIDRTPALGELVIDLSDFATASLAQAARRHILTLEEQLRLVLDASIENYTAPPADGVATPTPKRQPFDPKRYARIARPAPFAPRKINVTAMLMGDPSYGISVTAQAAGPSGGWEVARGQD